MNRTVASLDNLETLLLGGNWLGSDITMLSFSGVRWDVLKCKVKIRFEKTCLIFLLEVYLTVSGSSVTACMSMQLLRRDSIVLKRVRKSTACLSKQSLICFRNNFPFHFSFVKDFFSSRNLKKLDLSRCLISNVPNLWFKKLNHLEELDLSRNNIHWISDTVFARNTPLKTLRFCN